MKILLLLFCSTLCFGQVTFVSIALQPASGSSQVGPGPVTVDVSAASHQSGDLIVAVGEYRANASTWSVSTTGGQTWTVSSNITQTNTNVIYASCRFNGTWTANPAFSIASGTAAMTVSILAFRSTTNTDLWGIDVAASGQANVGPGGGAHTCTITGITTINNNNVAIANFHTNTSANTWSSLAGTGWTTAGSINTTNTGTGTLSSSTAYKIQSTGAATGNVSCNQSGNVAWGSSIIAYYAYPDPSASAVYTNPFFPLGIY